MTSDVGNCCQLIVKGSLFAVTRALNLNMRFLAEPWGSGRLNRTVGKVIIGEFYLDKGRLSHLKREADQYPDRLKCFHRAISLR